MNINIREFLSFFKSKRFLQLLIILLPVIIIFSGLLYLFINHFQYSVNDFLGKKLEPLKLIDAKESLKIQKIIMDIAFPIFILILGVAMLIWNTIYYYLAYIVMSKNFSPSFKINGIAFLFSVVIMAFLCGYIYSEYTEFKHFIENLSTYSKKGDITSEIAGKFRNFSNITGYFSMGIYLIFIIFDACQIHVSRIADDFLETKMAVQQLCFVDIVAGVGLLCVLIFTNFIDTTMMTNDISVKIFMSGANGMQIILSQLIFLFIISMYYYEKAKQDKSAKNTINSK